ncbi:CAAX protease self-immunity [Paenibacillaceae bacterium GAS479]|nr:CAAX protease self-immunity [Paenibacillaceae bacterium GAS479]
MLSSRQDQATRRYFWFGIIGVALFIILQILPSASGIFGQTEQGQPVSREQALESASTFAQQRFHALPQTSRAVHQADRQMTGYLAKEKLIKTFDSGAGRKVPVDLWQVTQNFEDGRRVIVDIGMTTGRVVGWRQLLGPAGGEIQAMELQGPDLDKAVQQASDSLGLGLLKRIDGDGNTGSSVQYEATAITISEARLIVTAAGESSAAGSLLTRFQPQYEAPAAYNAYTEEQDRIGASLSLFGNLLPSGILLILAVIYAIVMRHYTSFRRGWALSLVFLAFYAINNVNMLDGLRALYGQEVNAEFVVTAQLVFMMIMTVIMALSAYFSLVAGDGLWRAQGRILWTTGSEPGYGSEAWSSMKLAYVFTFIILGLQTIILGGLSVATGAWSTTDVTQSPYNTAAMWLIPLLAWCAAIQEEAVYRLFGTGLLMKWLKNPFIASLIPNIIWALGHVTYPIYPSTTRLIELTIIGMLFSFIFLRYGFFTAVFTHAIMNTVLMSVSLFLSGQPLELLAGVVYIFAPVAVAWLMRRYGAKRSAGPLAPV